jgi:hypothetical protein
MRIRSFQPGDEGVQVAIYNEAAAELPKFKPATVQEVQRRVRGPDFDPGLRFFAEDAGKVVGYVTGNRNGRVSFPWYKKGFDHVGAALFEHLLDAMKQKGHRKLFAAYRGDWPTITQFFEKQDFRRARDMLNFYIDLIDMPTPPARPSSAIMPFSRDDVPALFELGRDLLQVGSVAELDDYLFKNPYFKADSLFTLRSRTDDVPVAVGLLVLEPTYANAKVLDAAMPCFRLGAFGTERMQTKRINGLFSFVARKDLNVNPLGLDLMGYAAYRLRDTDDLDALAGQVPSDATYLQAFYQRNFRRQGSFPVFERELGT